MPYRFSLLFLQQNEKDIASSAFLFLYSRLCPCTTNDYYKRIQGTSLRLQRRYHTCVALANRLCVQTPEVQEQKAGNGVLPPGAQCKENIAHSQGSKPCRHRNLRISSNASRRKGQGKTSSDGGKRGEGTIYSPIEEIDFFTR